jgi:hypothetical protein
VSIDGEILDPADEFSAYWESKDQIFEFSGGNSSEANGGSDAESAGGPAPASDSSAAASSGEKLSPTQNGGSGLIAESGNVSDLVRNFRGMKPIRELGKGAYGAVTLAQDPSTGDFVALKTFNDPPGGQNIGDILMREVSALHQLSHPCVLEIVGFCLPPFEWIIE